MIRLIAALDIKNGIATEDGIPWKLPGDVEYFRKKTDGGILLMGRGVYEEFSEPLSNRQNYVLTHIETPLRNGYVKVSDLDEFISETKKENLWVIGGANLYAQTILIAEELYLTKIKADFNCTKFFPKYDSDFTKISTSKTYEEFNTKYVFEIWRRKA